MNIKSRKELITGLLEENKKGMIIQEMYERYFNEELNSIDENNTDIRLTVMKKLAEVSQAMTQYKRHNELFRMMLKEDE